VGCVRIDRNADPVAFKANLLSVVNSGTVPVPFVVGKAGAVNEFCAFANVVYPAVVLTKVPPLEAHTTIRSPGLCAGNVTLAVAAAFHPLIVGSGGSTTTAAALAVETESARASVGKTIEETAVEDTTDAELTVAVTAWATETAAVTVDATVDVELTVAVTAGVIAVAAVTVDATVDVEFTATAIVLTTDVAVASTVDLEVTVPVTVCDTTDVAVAATVDPEATVPVTVCDTCPVDVVPDMIEDAEVTVPVTPC